MRAGHVPGLGLAILNDRRVAYLKAYGERDTRKHLPLTIDSVMTSASFSKSTVAFMVMQLVQEANAIDGPVRFERDEAGHVVAMRMLRWPGRYERIY